MTSSFSRVDRSSHPATLSATIITYNEESNLRRCLESVKWVDEIIIVDSNSTDATLEIAREYGAVIHEIKWQGFGHAKQTCVDKATSDWILSIDADEELTPELTWEIRQIISSDSEYDGFDIPRMTNFLGRWIKHCGWYPDRILRLFRRDKGHFDGAKIHERVILEGLIGHLRCDLLHHCYPNLDLYLEKSNRYTSVGAQAAFDRGKRTTFFDLVVRPPVSFISHYLVRQGFRDGVEGFMVSVLSAVAVFNKYAKLRSLQKRPENKG